MPITVKSAVALLSFLALFPLELSAGIEVPLTKEELCGRIDEMLLANQLQALSLPTPDARKNDRQLKEAFVRICEAEASFSAAELSYSDGSPLTRGGKWFFASGAEHKLSLFLEAAGSARILGPFQRAHASCASGCSYTSWGIWGDEAHQRRRSCHNSGEAIDIHAITCGGRTHKALSGRFDEYVDCVRGSLGVIYRSANHFSHAHFQLHGCNMCQGLGCGGSGGGGGGGDDDSGDDDSGDDDSGDDDSGDDDEN